MRSLATSARPFASGRSRKDCPPTQWMRSGRAATWSGSRPSAAPATWRRSRAMLERHAFQLRLKAGAIEEYEREHRRVWPELLAKLKQVGISDYSIFRRGQELVL